MPASKANTKLRVAIPLVLVGAAIGLVSLSFIGGGGSGGSGNNQAPQPGAAQQGSPTPTEGSTDEPQPASSDAGEATSGETGGNEPAGADPPAQPSGQPAADTKGAPGALRARPQPPLPAGQTPTPVGSLDPSSGFELEVEPTLAGAGARAILLTHHYKTLDKQDHFTVQEQASFYDPGPDAQFGTPDDVLTAAIVPFSTHAVWIDDARIDLRGSSADPRWRETAPGTFIAEIVDESDTLVARITKTYTLDPGAFDFRVEHVFENLSGEELSVAWEANGPIDAAPEDKRKYGGDMRRMRIGTIRQGYVENTGKLIGSQGEAGRVVKAWQSQPPQERLLYPDSDRLAGAEGLAWLSTTGRYFATVMFADVPTNVTTPAPIPFSHRVTEMVFPIDPKAGRLHFRMTTPAQAVGPDQKLTTPFRVYAGPNSSKYLTAEASPRYASQSLTKLPVYSYGGMCAICTFQWLARPLLAVLRFFDSILGDWALSIMLLVVCVRSILHPITRKSQIGMLRFGKQMQAVQPKLKKLQEKYKGDPKKLQQEQVKLMREEGVNYAGMLGCLPMLLQSPIWIALYAMLFFAVDLRHEPAFYGLFQTLSGGSWPFLADLSAPDTFIPLPEGARFGLPLLGRIEGINILPLLLGIVYFFQQKYLTPPRSTAMTPEQEAQQKMMKVMIVVLFPLIIYNAPAGLAVYFITNSTLGIIESAWIRSHVNKDDLETEPKKKRTLQVQPKGGPQGGNPFKKERERKRFKER